VHLDTKDAPNALLFGEPIALVSQRSAEEATRRAVEAVTAKLAQAERVIELTVAALEDDPVLAIASLDDVVGGVVAARKDAESALAAERAKVAALTDDLRAANERTLGAYDLRDEAVRERDQERAKPKGLVAALREARQMIASSGPTPHPYLSEASIEAMFAKINAALAAAGEA